MDSIEAEHGASERLRVGITLDSFHVPAWIASVVDDVVSAPFVEVALVTIGSQDNTAGATEQSSWLFRQYREWDRERTLLERDPFEMVDLTETLAGVPRLASAAERTDVVVWLRSLPPEPPNARDAQYGVCFLVHGDGDEHAGWPSCFGEIYDRNPVTRVDLKVMRAGQAAPVIWCRAFSATEQGWSLRQNEAGAFWRAARFPLEFLAELQSTPAVSETGEPPATEPRSNSARRGYPSNPQIASFLLRNVIRTVDRRFRYSNKESYWFVAYRSESSRFVSQTENFNAEGFRVIDAPAGHFYADPFPIQRAGGNYLFVEDYLLAEGRGCISVMEITGGGQVGSATRVLDLPYHLSYPFVFEHGGAMYMIPETLGAERIELYRAVEFPVKWELVRVLRENVRAVDTTLHVENGTFYFFTNIAWRGLSVNDDLYLFYADELLGDWTAHPRNPICRDVRRSRGAGKLFRKNGRLIRPSQDCSVRYGYACQLNEVDVLSHDEYRERPVSRIEPDWYPGLIGTHTINSNEDLEVIDGQVYREKYKR